MRSVHPDEIRRLLVVRLSSMGDIIHTLPAVVALRQAFPDSLIGWAVEERWAELLCTLSTPRAGTRSAQRPLADRVHTANFAAWRSHLGSVRTWERIASGLSDLRAARYEVAIDFQGAVRSGLLASWSGATEIYGVAQPRENAASMFYTRQVIAGGTHVVRQNLSVAEALIGRETDIPDALLPIDPGAERQCDEFLATRGITQFAILNPGAGWGAKQWPAERYGIVAAELASCGLRVLINAGPGEECLAAAVQAASRGAAEVVTRSITDLIALTRRARLFIGGDTGPTHLACALAVPVVALFGPTDPARNGPFGPSCVVLRSPLSRTSHARRTSPEEGLLQITPPGVMAAAVSLMERNHG
jgi:heptosyltransferase-1